MERKILRISKGLPNGGSGYGEATRTETCTDIKLESDERKLQDGT